MQEYKEARERIFGVTSNRIKKARLRYKRRKQIRREIAATSLFEGADNRFYAKINMQGVEVEGLVDSGATVTCLGKGCQELVERAGLVIHQFGSCIRTADGSAHRMLGRVRAKINFGKKTAEVTFYLVPTLERALYLGVDFMRTFGLLANVESLTTQGVDLCEEVPNPEAVKTHTLTCQQNEILNGVVREFPCYARKGLGKTHLETHSIDTGNSVPVKDRFYPVSPAVQTLLYAEVDRMLDLGVIEPSESPWSHPVTLVRKGEKNRLCLDARKLNALTVKDAYPLPHIEGLLSRLGDTYYISSVDLKDAFWQIPLEPSSREKTAFTVPGRPLYHFKVMPWVV